MDLTSRENLERTSFVSRDQGVVQKEGGAVIITGSLWGNSSRKTVEEYRPSTQEECVIMLIMYS